MTSKRQGAHLQIDNLSKGYERGGITIDVLLDVSFEVQPGDMVAVVGQSGIGKSTLLHLLGTLDRPSKGTIKVDGRDLTSMSAAELAVFRNRHIGFVFQFHHLLSDLSALENVMLPVLINRSSKARAKEAAERLLGRVGLSHRIHHRPAELSGGEQQRVALARAMVTEPSLLLADEPTGNLDGKTGEGIHELLVELNEQRGSTMIVVTHNEDLASRMPVQYHMSDGGRMERHGNAPASADDAEPLAHGEEAQKEETCAASQ